MTLSIDQLQRLDAILEPEDDLELVLDPLAYIPFAVPDFAVPILAEDNNVMRYQAAYQAAYHAEVRSGSDGLMRYWPDGSIGGVTGPLKENKPARNRVWPIGIKNNHSPLKFTMDVYPTPGTYVLNGAEVEID